MSLRNRLVLAIAALLAVLALAFTGVALAQRGYVLRQLDQQLSALSSNPRVLVALSNRAQDGAGLGAELLGGVYVGVQRANGRLVTVLAPQDDPSLLPRLLGGERGSGPVTRGTASGATDRVRVVVAPLTEERSAVIAVSMAPVEAAAGRLTLSLALVWVVLASVAGLIGYWVDRLGLRPIARVTAAAEAVTDGGALPDRVDEGDPATEAGRLARAFNTMVAATAASQERLKQFVADASHELRTPLTTLRGYSSLHAQGALAEPDQVADAMRRINAEAARMSRIVDDLLDLAALDEGRSLARAPVPVGAVLADVAADLRATDPDRPVRVEATGELVVLADEDRLRQALAVLTTNARRYSPDGSDILLRASRSEGRVRLEVVDRGRGIPADALPRVFDRFYRVDSEEPRGARGSGLGLAIVAAIVAAHGGRYGVSSILGRGSTFWFDLPTALTPIGAAAAGS